MDELLNELPSNGSRENNKKKRSDATTEQDLPRTKRPRALVEAEKAGCSVEERTDSQPARVIVDETEERVADVLTHLRD